LNYFSSVELLRPDIDIEGWPLEDPSDFDSNLVVSLVEQEIGKRPIYLASLSEAFYAARFLAGRYCIVPELNLYRVHPAGARVSADLCQIV
jgi:hypothetical protein